MIKKIFLAIAVMFSMGFAANAQKFAVVYADEIISVMPEVAEIQTRLAEASKQYEDEYGKLQEEMQKKYQEYQELEKDASTPQGIKERRLQEISDLDRKAQQFAQTAQQDLQRQQAQLFHNYALESAIDRFRCFEFTFSAASGLARQWHVWLV